MPFGRASKLISGIKTSLTFAGYGVTYLSKRWPETLRDVSRELRRLSRPDPVVAAKTPSKWGTIKREMFRESLNHA